MSKREKEYKIKRGQLDGTPGKLSYARMVAGSLLCIAAAFVLAYFWQYGALGNEASAMVDAPALTSSPVPPQDTSSSSQPAGSRSTPSASSQAGVSSQGADTLVVPQPGADGLQSASSQAQQEAPGETEALVVGGEAQQSSSAQEVGGTKRDFSVAYQVKASEAVTDDYFDDALFVGDSITTGIEIYGTMSGAAVVASTGINPSTILSKPAIRDKDGNLHTVLETMGQYQPEKIYLLLGANGVGWIEQDSFIGYYEELIDRIREQHPKALLYVQSIFPVTAEKALGENGIYSNERIDSYNAALMALCEKKGLPYLNVAEALRGPDGALPAEASSDGIHIIPEYYRKWFDYLKTHTVQPGQEKAGRAKGEGRPAGSLDF